MSSIPVALVTGASRGLGRAIARRLVTDGYHVAAAGRDRDQLAALAAELGAERLMVLPFDVGDSAAIASAVEALGKRWGRLDALINAAGVSSRAPIDSPEAAETWGRVLDVNLGGTFHVTRLALPLLVDGGRIVNLASDLGKTGMAAYAAYCASKHGVIGLTRALALELAPRAITVNAICPGWVETAMAEQGFEELARAIGASAEQVREGERQAVPLGRFATPDEVAALAAYLLSPPAAIMTGQALNLCGGTVIS